MASPQILILSSWYPNQQQPFLGNFVERHAALLAKKYDVTVLNTQVGEVDQLQIETIDQGEFTEVRVHHPKGKGMIERRKMQEKAMELGMAQIATVDLIIGHIILPKGLQFVQAKKHYNCPLIYVEHGSYFRPKNRKNWQWFEKLIVRMARRHIDAIVAVSSFLKKDMQADFPRRDIHVIGNHVDETLFTPVDAKPNENTRFLHVSTLDEKTKNPEGLLCAFKNLSEHTPDFHLTVVSDEDFSHWEQLANQFGLSEQIEFVGPLAWNALPDYYHNSDAFVLFSEYESFSIVLAEAWMTGTPVITTPVGAAYQMPKELGMHVAIDEKKVLTSALIEFIEERKSTFDSATIAEYGQRFSSDAILDQWSKLIDQHVR